jgi:hypothetical protein
MDGAEKLTEVHPDPSEREGYCKFRGTVGMTRKISFILIELLSKMFHKKIGFKFRL